MTDINQPEAEGAARGIFIEPPPPLPIEVVHNRDSIWRQVSIALSLALIAAVGAMFLAWRTNVNLQDQLRCRGAASATTAEANAKEIVSIGRAIASLGLPEGEREAAFAELLPQIGTNADALLEAVENQKTSVTSC